MTKPHSKSEQLAWEFCPHSILSMISHKKWCKDKFEAYQHTCNFPDKICPLHYHRHIKNGLKCSVRGRGVPIVVRLVAYRTWQNGGNNCNDICHYFGFVRTISAVSFIFIISSS